MPQGITAAFLYLILLLYNFNQPKYARALDTITQSQKISVGQTLTSSDGTFEIGFFNPGNSSRQYVGIWYTKIPVHNVVWVANRETPIKASDKTASLTISQDGNLLILDGNRNFVWSSNISVSANESVAAVLQDNGNLVLKDVDSGAFLWESFRYPGDISIPEMKMGMNTKTGEKWFLSSWKTEDDPASGNFVHGFTGLQSFTWNKSIRYWRSGQWNGVKYIGVPLLDAIEFLPGYAFVRDPQQGTQYFTLGPVSNSLVRNVYLAPSGSMALKEWDETKRRWTTLWKTPESACDIYGSCGPFGVCNKNQSPICRCLNGFVSKSEEEWKKGNWTNGCKRQTELLCERNKNNASIKIQANDGFLRLNKMKLPDFSDHERFDIDNAGVCAQWCLNNCSCIAYAYVVGIRCMVWKRDLLDIQEFWTNDQGEALFLRIANSDISLKKKKLKLIIGILISSSIVFIGILLYAIIRWRSNHNSK